MATNTVRLTDKGSLTRFLGWFSVGLGTVQLTAPRLLCRIVGADDGGRNPAVMRLMGARELTQGVGILGRPRPTAWVWSRVAGDALDLALLAGVAVRNPGRRLRAAFALANVAAITTPDVAESLRLSRRRSRPDTRRRIRKAVTINMSRQGVEAAWLGAVELRRKIEDADASVSFSAAPGERGTELAIEFEDEPKGDDLGRLAAKLSGNDLATGLSDGLRRFKQRVETGEVVRSDSTPAGHLLAGHIKQRPAQPLEAVR
jgi:hypothetical protein